MSKKSLLGRGVDLAVANRQLQILADPNRVAGGRFEAAVRDAGVDVLRRRELEIVQVNVGRVCNQTCAHCHVDAGPDRRESMSYETAEAVIDFLSRSSATTLDITGGAPEMNPYFRWLVRKATRLGCKVIDRCNLTILLAPRYEDLADFLASHRVTVIASLPCYLEENCDAQRGEGVFAKSIQALRLLNSHGYGDPETGLELHLVYNPIGPHLPPEQSQLESAYKEQLASRFGIRFNNLFTITNVPISRFLFELLQHGDYEAYMETLISSFNPATLDGLMCRNTISIDWEGYVYDCDFNQMLGLSLSRGETSERIHISELTAADLSGRPIRTANHCFACTAGCGSSCQGSLASG